MNKRAIKILKAIIPIFLGIVIIVILYKSTTVKDREDILKYIQEADYFWVFVSLFLALLSHLSRAYRWKYLLEPLGYKPKFMNSFMAVMIAYFANLGIPRSGEVLRATTMTAYEGIPFEKGFGTIVAERMADLVMSFVIIGIALIAQYDIIANIITDRIPENPLTLILLAIGFLILTLFVVYLMRSSKHKIVLKIKSFLNGLKEGIISIFKMKQKWAFIFHTFFIWFMYVMMFYVVFLSLDETKNINIGATLTSFVTGSFTIAATNGGIGFYQLAMQETLFLFGYPKNVGLAFGWILWSAQTIMTIVIGLLAFFLIPIFNRKK